MKKLSLIIGFILLFSFSGCEKDFGLNQTNDQNLDSSELKKADNRGMNEYGFNWKAHHFNGYLVNVYFSDTYFQYYPFYNYPPYQGEGEIFIEEFYNNFGFFVLPEGFLDCKLVMHWNEALISSEGVYPETWVDTGGWITFHYKLGEGKDRWSQFRKYVATKSTDVLDEGLWYTMDGELIGKFCPMWPELVLLKVVNTGDVPDIMPIEYIGENSPGFGKYK